MSALAAWFREGLQDLRRLRAQLFVGAGALAVLVLTAALVESPEASRWIRRATTPVVLGLVLGWRRLESASAETRAKLAQAAATFAAAAGATALAFDFLEHSLPQRPGLLLWVGLLAIGLWGLTRHEGEQA